MIRNQYNSNSTSYPKHQIGLLVAILKVPSNLVFEFNAFIVWKDKSSSTWQICVVSILACRRILQGIRDTEIKGNNSVSY